MLDTPDEVLHHIKHALSHGSLLYGSPKKILDVREIEFVTDDLFTALCNSCIHPKDESLSFNWQYHKTREGIVLKGENARLAVGYMYLFPKGGFIPAPDNHTYVSCGISNPRGVITVPPELIKRYADIQID